MRLVHLPDDILVIILSLLTLKEAVVTSILSRRWQNLWTSLLTLNFRYGETVHCNDYEWDLKWGLTIDEADLNIDLYEWLTKC